MAKLNVVSLIAFLAGLIAVIEAGDFIIFNEVPPTVLDCNDQRLQVLAYWAECNINLPFDECPLFRRRSTDINALTDTSKETTYTKFDDRLIEPDHNVNSFLQFGKPLYSRLAVLDLEVLEEKCCMPEPESPVECEMLPTLCPGGNMYDEGLFEQMIKGGCEIFIEENL